MSAEQTPDIEVVHSVLAESVGIYDLTEAEAAAFARLYHERALAPVLAAAVREAEQRALRDAADEYERMYQQPGSATGADWLRDRADRVAEPQHEAATEVES